MGGVLKTIVSNHAGKGFVEAPAVGPKRLPIVPAVFQEAGLGNRTPHQNNLVHPDTGNLLRVVYVTNPVTKHLKDLYNGVLRVLKHVVHMHFCAEGHPVNILLGSIFTGDMPTSNG